MFPETFKASMKEHYEMDKELNKKELNKIYRELGEHSKCITRIFNVGEQHGQQKRAIANATVHVNGQLPYMNGSVVVFRLETGIFS